MSVKVFSPNEGIRDSDKTLIFSLMARRTIRQNTVTVDVAATKIPTTPLSNRLFITIKNISANIIYIGDATVTTANGFELTPQSSFSLYIEDTVDIYGISTVASEVRIIEGA